MKTLRRLCTILGVLAITAAALGLVTVSAGSSIALASPAELAANMRPAAAPPPVRPFADPLPATTCTLVGQTRTCEVWAMEGTTTMPDGVVVTIWGFTDSATGTAELPGPTLVVSEGERVEVIFHNTLDQNVSLSFPGQAIFPPDLIGVGQGLSKTYAFTATNPGTYLYEAGLTPNGGRQVAMGLYGGFIVRPATAGQAYNDVVSAYDDEALLIFSEIDPAFNAAPMTFSMQDFSPQYWLINGQAFADTPNISTTAGSRVLLRMVNGGIDHRSISLLGLQQTIVGIDGVSLPITRTRTVVAESIGPGQAVDTIAAIPAGAQTGTLYTIFNGALQNHNADARLTDGSLAFGGMLTFIEITAGTAASDGGPVVTSAEAVPSPTAGDTDVELTFVISATNGGTVVAYRRAVGTVPSDAGTPLTPAPVVTVTEIVAAAELGLWDSDYYEFYVSGRDNDGVWGPVGSAILNLDK
ncbi:MAG: multicopper oxidase domain-containing protein, partial [Anaerolineae bacterium]|nr:multicopper oxidase domain-containing protein [Anaerolineae bacterium]